LVGNISNSRGDFDGQVCCQPFCIEIGMLTGTNRIKTISLNVIAKFKSENPDFDIDFESFVKDLSTEETVLLL
jgi:hypothetical protein